MPRNYDREESRTISRRNPFPVLWVVGGVFGVLVLLGGGLFTALLFNAIGKSGEAQQKRVEGLPTCEEMKQQLVGKSEAEVLKLLGKPSSASENSWLYKSHAKNRVTGDLTYFFVHFANGVVTDLNF